MLTAGGGVAAALAAVIGEGLGGHALLLLAFLGPAVIFHPTFFLLHLLSPLGFWFLFDQGAADFVPPGQKEVKGFTHG